VRIISRQGLLSLVFGLGIAYQGCQERSKGAPNPAVPASATERGATGTEPAASVASKASAPAPPAPRKPLNVLLITIDSLRADMPWTGYARPIAPNLTEFAKQSIVYTNAYSVSSYTAKSVAAVLTGRYPSTLYRSGWFFANYSKANQFFTETLQDRGIRTIGWHGHLYFGRGKGLEQGFDVWELAPGITFDPNTDKHVTSDKMTQLGIEILSKPENTAKQFFAWVHYMDPHDQYIKHAESPDFGNKNRDRYDSEVFFTDLWLGKFLDWAKKQAFWDSTAIIVSADHGEAFGEHGMHKHAFELWEVLTRIPLLIRVPGAEPRRIDARRSAIDLSPTVLELMGQKPLEAFMGKSLVPEVFGAPAPERDVILLELTEDSHNPQRSAVLAGDYKLIVHDAGSVYQLYNLKDDPGEERDLAKSQPDKLAEMKQVYSRTYAGIPRLEPYGGMKLKSGRAARGPTGPSAASKN
jgi:choline-sulfatase